MTDLPIGTTNPPSPELLHALGRLIRGLSALFWGLPIALVICVQTAKTSLFDLPGWINLLFPLASTGLLYYGLVQLCHFQKQERIWILALERAKLVGLSIISLSPFLYWYHKLPEMVYYVYVIDILAVLGVLFLLRLNDVLNRLAAMLPDEAVRIETAFFTSMNRYMLFSLPVIIVGAIALSHLSNAPRFVITLLMVIDNVGQWFTLLLVLIPLALTMTLLWKIKEVIVTSVFGQDK